MWIILELTDPSFLKNVSRTAIKIIEDLGGYHIRATALFGRVTINASFHHRRVKVLERAVNLALWSMPVTKVSAHHRNPLGSRRRQG